MTLDELAKKYPCGTMIAARTNDQNPDFRYIGMVVGVCWSLPRVAGGPNEPALVTQSATGLGNVYPHEVVESR